MKFLSLSTVQVQKDVVLFRYEAVAKVVNRWQIGPINKYK